MSEEVKKMRDLCHEALEKRYGALTPLRGKGVQSGSRYSFQENGKIRSCAIKASTTPAGRIHFPYSDGTWGVLSEVDYILYARQKGNLIELQFHKQSNIMAAFNKNREAAEAGDFTNLPAWLSPDLEDYFRFVGSGFGRDAIWTERFGEPPTSSGNDIPNPSDAFVVSSSSVGDFIEAHKQAIAHKLGKAVEDIEIVVRW